jgi:hypothetical protein
MPDMFDVSEIQTFGVQNEDKIRAVAVMGNELVGKGLAQIITNLKEPMAFTSFSMEDPSQPFRQAFEPKSDVGVFGKRIIAPQTGKVDLEIWPLKFRTTYLARKMQPGVNPEEIPYPRFFWDQVGINVGGYINKRSVWHGVHNPAGTTTQDIADGLGKIVSDEITAGNLDNVVTTGVITKSNAVEKFEDIVKSLPAEEREEEYVLLVPYALYDNYNFNYRGLFGGVTWNAGYVKRQLDGFPNITIMPCAFFGNSRRVVLTKTSNIGFGTDLLFDFEKMQIIPDIRVLKIAMHYVLAYQFADLRELYVNDQV